MQLVIFLTLSLALAWYCRRQLVNPRCHGFYRFFAFVGILWLLVRGIPLWHERLLSLPQILATALMLAAAFFLVSGARRLGRDGGRRERRQPAENFAFENTARLVTSGIYRYVRHPMYTSLLLLAWGVYLKETTVSGFLVAMGVSVALLLTALVEERENRSYFGSAYESYQAQSRLFIPFVL